jgi:hypothetical protein
MSDSLFNLSLDDCQRLVLIDADGRRHVGVDPIRTFPLSEPDRRISLCDESGHEVAWIDDLATLRPSARRLIEQVLAVREFTPIILRILKISGDSAPSDWDVQTDRGATRFLLDSEDHIRKLGKNRLLITDALGLRYQIPDAKSLDGASRRLLERYL